MENVRAIDLNLLAVFEAVFLERGVTRAAQRLGLTQPAVSNALSRLRGIIGDPLFIRAADGMTPTPRALVLGPVVQIALASLREAVGARGFDPSGSSRQFTVAALDYVDALDLAPLAARLRAAAPKVSLRVRRLDAIFDWPQVELENGAVDAAIGLFPHPLPPSSALHGRVLRSEPWAGLVRQGHPALERPLSLSDYAGLDHVAINVGRGGGSMGYIDNQLTQRALARRCSVTVGSFLSVPFHLALSDAVATLPQRLAECFARVLPLQAFKPPALLEPLDLSLVWHERSQADPAQAWLRDLIVQTYNAASPIEA